MAEQAKPIDTKPTPITKPGQQQHAAPTLFESAIQWAEHKEPRLVVDVPAHTPYEKLFDPTFWANVSPRIPAGAILICRDEENSYRAELLVRNSGRGWVKVEEIHKHDFKVSTGAPAKAERHGVEFVNPNTRWRVFRLVDNATIKSGFPDWESAHKAMLEHERVLAA
jgi:hypothetical protein